MKRKISLFRLLQNLFMVFIVSLVAGSFFGPSAFAAVGTAGLAYNGLQVIAGKYATFNTDGLLYMAVQVEIWVDDISANIYPDNAFYMQSRDDSPFMEGKTIHLPQSGSAPGVSKNRTSLPATAAKRTDTETDYDVDEHTTDPIILQDTEKVEASYDKRASILFDHVETLTTSVAESFIDAWAPDLAANFVRTSGTSRSALSSGQTGNRKRVAKADFIEINRLFNRMDVPKEGRFLLLPADLEADIMLIDEFVRADAIGASSRLISGSIGTILGISIFVRSSVGFFDNTATPVLQPDGTATGAAFNAFGLAWHKNYVRRALGNSDNGGIKIFEKNDDPQFYGDVISALVRAGGAKARADQKGVIALIETAA